MYSDKNNWKLESENFPLLTRYATKINSDYLNKELHVDVLDVHVDGKPLTENWIKKIINGCPETLVLTQLSLDGDVVSKNVFSGVKVIGHKCERDLEFDSLCVEHSVIFKYDNLEK